MKPNLNYVLILPDEPIIETSLIIPDTIVEPYVKGTVLEIGNGVYNQRTGDLRLVQTRKGDRVCYVPNTGFMVAHGELNCILLREEEIFTRNGEPINDWIGVQFDEEHNRVVKFGDLEIARPNGWVYEDHGGDQTMYDVNRDLKNTVPQIATIIKPNKNYGLVEGDTVYTHYLQYDMAITVDGVKYIKFNAIFFKVNGEHDYEMADGILLAKRIVVEAPRTASGIFLTADEDKKEPLRLEVTHVPRDTDIKVGDTIITADDNQYEINLHNEKYVKITPDWIVGVVEK